MHIQAALSELNGSGGGRERENDIEREKFRREIGEKFERERRFDPNTLNACM